MVTKKLRIVVDGEAKKSLKEAYRYIRKDSLQNAEKVRAKILATIKELPKNPAYHAPDKYRIKNEGGTYRRTKLISTELPIMYQPKKSRS